MNITSRNTRSSLAVAGMVALLGVAPAFAADVVMEEPPAPMPVETLPVASWAGAYVGLSAGYGFSGQTTETIPGTGLETDIDTDGFIGGAFAGYQWQNGGWVYGIEGDVNYNGMDGESDNGALESESSIDGSLRARLGYAVTPDVLIYATAGGAAQSLKVRDPIGSDSNTMIGWTAGAGTDMMFSERVFGRVEYRYTDYGSDQIETGLGVRDVDASDHRVTFGVGLKF
ncbi:outer membrane protein [Arvimicrobium flavum]|uniref:outer membrane protein n=1 Tax=Arvimicrobium flavum TaxID=3393320 RepID=UPI00237BACC4|nr:outer membrane protein [Mesorhizobium shangrilense]